MGPQAPLTIAQVRQWNPDALTTAGGHANTIADTLDSHFATLQTALGNLGWHGAAGGAAGTRVQAEKNYAGGLSAGLLALEAALNSRVKAMKAAVADLNSAVHGAERAGFAVDGSGNVTIAANTVDLHKQHSSPTDQVALTREAYGWHLRIVQALANAEAAYEATAKAAQQALGQSGFTAAPPPPVGTAPAPAATASYHPAGYAPTAAALGGGSWGGGSHGGGGGFGGFGSSGGPPAAPPSGQMSDWIQQALEVLRDNGVDTSNISPADIATIIEHESGGNPDAINLWDSNAAAGHPSKGLMQTIDSTFEAFALPGHSDVWNPVDNIVAGVRYAMNRYGSIDNVPGVVAVHNGGGYVGY
jgi:hypothetical protein